MDAGGRFPMEMQRTTSLHYSVFVLDAFILIDKMAGWNGNPYIKKGIEALLPYLMQDKQWDGQQIKEFEFDEAIPILNEASWKYDCKKCDAAIRKVSGEKYERLRIHLMN